MSATTPELRPELVQGDVEIAAPVRAVTWAKTAALQCWAAGRGSMDVPIHCPGVTVPAGGSSTFRYRIWPRYQTCRYRLTLGLYSADVISCDVDFPIGASSRAVQAGPREYVAADGRRYGPYITPLDADRSSQSSSEAEIGCTISPPAGAAVKVDSVSIEAIPRVFLTTDNSDLGAARELFQVRQPIMEPNIHDEVFARNALLRDACRRTGMLQHSWGSDSPKTITSAATNYGDEDVFAAPVGLLGRAIYSGDTVRSLSCRVRAYMSNGSGSGDIRLTASSGDSVTINVPAGTSSPDWFPSTGGAAASLDVDAEDNTTSNGLRGGSWDDVTIEARTDGLADLYIETISVGEA